MIHRVSAWEIKAYGHSSTLVFNGQLSNTVEGLFSLLPVHLDEAQDSRLKAATVQWAVQGKLESVMSYE